MIGAGLGFLWFNCHPAKVFMGDTGSLALGGSLGIMAVLIHQPFVLVIAGGVFVLEALSVMLQRGWFKWTRLRTGEGQRIFLMAPAPSLPEKGLARKPGGDALLHPRHSVCRAGLGNPEVALE